MNPHITATKQFRKDLDEVLQELKTDCGYCNVKEGQTIRSGSERLEAMKKIKEAIMWLGMDLKAIDEENPGSAPSPYPESYNPQSQKIERPADGLKL